jgi:Immunity protein 42
MPILIGNKSIFAIESSIARAFESKHFKALGFIVIHVGGLSYGIHEPEATMLGASYGEVKMRILRRGTHSALFAQEESAGKIADAFRDAIYAHNQEREEFFGIRQPDFKRIIYDNNLMWVPDGDEAFDDGSYALQFDVGNQVRLIAFKASNEGGNYHHDPTTIRDIWLAADDFYGILERWRGGFEAEWNAALKQDDAGSSWS